LATQPAGSFPASGVALGQVTVLLPALHLPAARYGTVARRALVDRLHGEMRAKLVPHCRAGRLGQDLPDARLVRVRRSTRDSVALRGPGRQRFDPVLDWRHRSGAHGLPASGGGHSERVIRGITGDSRQIVDYFAAEVMGGQQPRVRSFLLQTSVLGRFSGPMCDAVTGVTGSQELLEELEKNQLFLFPSTPPVAGTATTPCSPSCCAANWTSRTQGSRNCCTTAPPLGTPARVSH
jgi:hypothetical protein